MVRAEFAAKSRTGIVAGMIHTPNFLTSRPSWNYVSRIAVMLVLIKHSIHNSCPLETPGSGFQESR